MTPEREKEIRADLKRGRLMFPAGDVHDLLAEIDRLRETIELCRKDADQIAKYASLKAAAEPFITHSAKLVQAAAGKAYVTIEVPMDDILTLRKELRGS